MAREQELTTYLVTGGAGFIGSHLTDRLLSLGNRVIAYDNLFTGGLENLASVRDHPNFRFVQSSVLDFQAVDEVMHEADVVVHLAAAVGVRLIVEQPLKSLVTNIRGSEILLDRAEHYGRKTLLASTSEIYGKNTNVPLDETADRVLGSPAVARWAYSTAKAVDEILAYAYQKERGLPTVVARLFNTVGPRQSHAYGMVIPRLVHQALAGEPLTVFGDGNQTRCFCHVGDVVDALVHLLDHPGAEGDVFNVGSSEEVTILELAERIMERTGSSSAIELISYDEAYETGFEDMVRRVPDISKIRALTGWEPRLKLDQILDDVIANAAVERPDTALTE
jgi:UDP-glucose 4-epimerase